MSLMSQSPSWGRGSSEWSTSSPGAPTFASEPRAGLAKPTSLGVGKGCRGHVRGESGPAVVVFALNFNSEGIIDSRAAGSNTPRVLHPAFLVVTSYKTIGHVPAGGYVVTVKIQILPSPASVHTCLPPPHLAATLCSPFLGFCHSRSVT